VSAVGIIANPASGKDIRRLVAHGSVFDNHEKANIVRRVLLGLDALGVERALIMPDSFGIGARALDGLRLSRLVVSVVEMPVTFTSTDSVCAARLMVDAGVGCLITLGGDGTNRMVAQASGDVPLMPISTGTNNVFPDMVEGTLAGLAAGLVCLGLAEAAVARVACLEVRLANTAPDMALIDVGVYDERFVAARAVWDPSRILELVLARVEPGTIGLSSIGAHLGLSSAAHLRMGEGGQEVLAPIAPGIVAPVNVASYRSLAAGDEVRLCQPRPCTLAFDGEREVSLAAHEEVHVKFVADGPKVVDVRRTMAIAAQSGVFVSGAPVVMRSDSLD
jgi:predicted polyphosphate/ATP-dependent NAD kinase